MNLPTKITFSRIIATIILIVSICLFYYTDRQLADGLIRSYRAPSWHCAFHSTAPSRHSSTPQDLLWCQRKTASPDSRTIPIAQHLLRWHLEGLSEPDYSIGTGDPVHQSHQDLRWRHGIQLWYSQHSFYQRYYCFLWCWCRCSACAWCW